VSAMNPTVRARWWCGFLLLLMGALSGCTRSAPSQRRPGPAVSGTRVALPAANAGNGQIVTNGDAARGRELVEHFECNRCHEGTGLTSAPLTKNCFSCHEQIITGKFPVSAAALARFRPHVASARDAPSLTGIGSRLEPRWVIEYLLAPHDLRPKLIPNMPRLELNRAQATDIAAYLSRNETTAPDSVAGVGNALRGRELMEQKGCASCHEFSGVAPFAASAAPPPDTEAARAAALAPDLRFTRDRFRPDRLLGFLLNPRALKADTRMPNFEFTPAEAADIAAYIRLTPLADVPAARFERLPVLSRRVSFEEANRRVFSRTCHHCHTDTQSAGGDGGPGNTGGFGFAPRGISFSSHASILAGYLDEHGERRSLFEPTVDGTPRLVAALLARHDEARSAPRAGVRGMPLGLPPLSPEDIQLVESWVAQGKPL